MGQPNKPVKKFKAGAVSLTVWENKAVKDNKEVVYNTFSPQRAYKDKAGEWQNTTQLRTSDLPLLVLCLNEAFKWKKMKDSE
jgi:hypothetical protein